MCVWCDDQSKIRPTCSSSQAISKCCFAVRFKEQAIAGCGGLFACSLEGRQSELVRGSLLACSLFQEKKKRSSDQAGGEACSPALTKDKQQVEGSLLACSFSLYKNTSEVLLAGLFEWRRVMPNEFSEKQMRNSARRLHLEPRL